MFARKLMSLFLPVLVMSMVTMMPTKATAQMVHPTPQECCASLINIEIEPTIVFAPTVNVASFWNDVEILTFENILSNNAIASNNEVELTNFLHEVNVLSENQVVVGLINGVVYYLDNR